MVCLIINGKKLPHCEKLIQLLENIKGMTSICLNINTRQTNVILGDNTIHLWGKPYITDRIGNTFYRISAQSFFQVNPVQTVRLYEKVLEFADLKGEETVWDLYCGAGTISLFLAPWAAKVNGVEIIPQAIENARENAAINSIRNAEFYVGKSEDVFPQKVMAESTPTDLVVVDPPRKGCDPLLLNTLLKVLPPRIIYVSCDPATLARDLAILCKDKYRLVRVCPTDMFPHTVHVETVCLLTHNVVSEEQ